jgi:hypothetical protein
MNEGDISKAKNPDLGASQEALRRAAELARQTAIQTDTDLIIVKDGRMVRIPAAELREQARLKPSPTP